MRTLGDPVECPVQTHIEHEPRYTNKDKETKYWVFVDGWLDAVYLAKGETRTDEEMYTLVRQSAAKVALGE